MSDRFRHSKWIALLVWLALLIATLFTSYTAFSAATASGLVSYFVSLFRLGAFAQQQFNLEPNRMVGVVIIQSLLGLLAIVWVVMAWMRMVALTRSLVVAMAWLEEQEEESTLFTDWLIFPPKSGESAAGEEGPDLDEAEQTLASAVLRYLAFAWIVLLVMPPVLMLASLLFA